ncbi:MAG: hypothetical protein GX493_11815 [Firmicutes bacterium]|nr:hypothetical protein [Bacillota bacterium]
MVEWFLAAHSVPDWVRPPVIGHSQVGYRPCGKKVAVIELDGEDPPLARGLSFAGRGKRGFPPGLRGARDPMGKISPV